MISKVMASNVQPSKAYSIKKQYTPSFGFARLNEYGRTTADSFNYTHNTFLHQDMFRRQGIFRKSAIEKELDNLDFDEICTKYGCTENGAENAAFIKSQILSKKGQKAYEFLVTKEERDRGLRALYSANYDNPDLTLNDTKELLELAKTSMDNDEYIKNVGLLEAGTVKY